MRKMTPARLVGGITQGLLTFALPLFLPAWTVHWWRAWVFLAVTLVVFIAAMIALWSRQGLLEERSRPLIQKDQPPADKIIAITLVVTLLGTFAFIPMDVFRWHLFPEPSEAISIAGLVLYVLSWVMMIVAMRTNDFAAAVIKHQKDRGQRVIDTGVYGIVRHPMYAAFVPFVVGMTLWLQSYAAAIMAILPLATLLVRIGIEERFLKLTLEGYEAYTKRVRYRLIPFVW
jgi:protein-S-isoprenylcysteine O-methyltransferase Ste14